MQKCVAKLLVFLGVLLTHQLSIAIDLQIPEHLKKDYECMVKNLHHESRGEGGKGIIAVANVVMNRVRHPAFPDTVCDVVYQKHQFSWVKDKRIKHTKAEDASDKAKILAYEAVVNNSLKDNTGGAVFFHTVDSGFSWNSNGKAVVTRRLGNHIFYKYRGGNNDRQNTERRI